MPKQQIVLVIDAGGQTTQTMARMVRRLDVYCEVVPYFSAADAIKKSAPIGLIVCGENTADSNALPADFDDSLFEQGLPVLAVGSGAALMIKAFGGKLSRSEAAPKTAVVAFEKTDGLLADVTEEDGARLPFSDAIATLPNGFIATATRQNGDVVAAENKSAKLFAALFHPEMPQTTFGESSVRKFLYDVCGAIGSWTTDAFIDKAIADIKDEVGDSGKVLCAISGGVDSSVAAVLTHRAIQDRLTCVFVDNGLMRKNEGDEVMELLGKQQHLNVLRVNGAERFLNKLKTVTDPEKKRTIIGHEFIEIFSEEAGRLGAIDHLLQGTIYPDVIESGVGDAAVVKSHHNVGGLPEKLGFKLLEPLRSLFKDEVREVGRALGLPEEMVARQPFPGPGLAVRCLGEVTEEKLFIIRESDAILRAEIRDAGLQPQIFQYFTVLPNVRSVGVTDGERTYNHAIGIRAVHSVDGMTSDWVRLPYDVLERISDRILEEVPGVNRVLYDCTKKPPGTIEWE